MAATHTSTVTPAGNGAFTITCTCGEKVTYSGEQFTKVEAMRHDRWHASTGR